MPRGNFSPDFDISLGTNKTTKQNKREKIERKSNLAKQHIVCEKENWKNKQIISGTARNRNT